MTIPSSLMTTDVCGMMTAIITVSVPILIVIVIIVFAFVVVVVTVSRVINTLSCMYWSVTNVGRAVTAAIVRYAVTYSEVTPLSAVEGIALTSATADVFRFIASVRVPSVATSTAVTRDISVQSAIIHTRTRTSLSVPFSVSP